MPGKKKEHSEPTRKIPGGIGAPADLDVPDDVGIPQTSPSDLGVGTTE